MTHPDDLIYPSNLEYNSNGDDGEPIINTKTSFGLTKREHFSALFMNGLLSSCDEHDVTDYDDLANDSVKAADALIKQLNNQ